MSRAAASTAVILALLTGLVLGQLGTFAGRPHEGGARPSIASPQALATARTFYGEMDHLLETGERTIEGTLAADFTEHRPDGQGDRTMPEMVDGLLAMRASWPRMHIRVISLEQHDSLIVAQLEIDPGTAAPVPGVPLPAFAPFPVSEYLRIDEGGVTDRWSADTNLPVVAFAIQTEFAWRSASIAVPAMLRVALAPGEKAQLPFDGPAVVRVESGMVQLDRDGDDLGGKWHPATDSLDAGDVRVLDIGGPVLVRNSSSAPAEVWAFTANLRPVSTASAGGPIELVAPRIASFMLTDGAERQGPILHLAVTRITIPAHTEIAPDATAGVEGIVVLEGSIAVTIGSGRALVSTAAGETELVEDSATIAAGESISVRDTSALGFGSAGSQPATLLIMRSGSSVSGSP